MTLILMSYQVGACFQFASLFVYSIALYLKIAFIRKDDGNKFFLEFLFRNNSFEE